MTQPVPSCDPLYLRPCLTTPVLTEGEAGGLSR